MGSTGWVHLGTLGDSEYLLFDQFDGVAGLRDDEAIRVGDDRLVALQNAVAERDELGLTLFASDLEDRRHPDADGLSGRVSVVCAQASSRGGGCREGGGACHGVPARP